MSILILVLHSAIWVCLKIGYIPNYSHLIGIIFSKTIGFRGTQHFQTHPLVVSQFLQRFFSLLKTRFLLLQFQWFSGYSNGPPPGTVILQVISEEKKRQWRWVGCCLKMHYGTHTLDIILYINIYIYTINIPYIIWLFIMVLYTILLLLLLIIDVMSQVFLLY